MNSSSRQAAPALAEELVVCGYTRAGGAAQWLDEAEALRLLEEAAPAANVEDDERRLGVQQALDQVAALGADLDALAQARAQRLHGSHQRVRAALGSQAQASVTPRTPDVLGVYVLLPA